VMARWRGQVIGIHMSKLKGQTAVMASTLTSLDARKKCRGLLYLLFSKQMELIAQRGVHHLVYGKFGLLPGLDEFKVRNGFRPVGVNYNHLFLSKRALVLAKFGLHRRPDVMACRYSSILPFVSSLQRHLPPNLTMKLHFFF
jgi:hypothetical protein